MEFTEVVSPSVAVPVLCVLVCAFLVFAFGFKSSAQPPSFDVFDDEKKKRTKRSKGSKSQSNGHAVIAGEGDANNSAKPQSSPRQTAKQSSKTQPAVTKSKSASQTTQEAPKKTKKQAVKEEEVKSVKKQKVQEDIDVDGWHTVPKKDKKQKKKESEPRQERQDSPVKEEEIVETIEETVAASLDVDREAPGSPQEQRSKKKKEKKNKKAKSDEETVEQIKTEAEIVVETTPSVAEPEMEIVIETTPCVAEPEPEPVDPSIELQIQDAMETMVDDESGTTDKKKRNKKKAFEEDDFVIPQAALEPKFVERKPEASENLPLKENTDALTVKVPKKKQKKDRNKKNEERLPENVEIGASGGVDSSLSQSSVSDIKPKKTKLKDTSIKEEPPVIECSPGAEGGAASDVSSPPQPSATFDELGGMTESWMEAKPKSKKKKTRRAD